MKSIVLLLALVVLGLGQKEEKEFPIRPSVDGSISVTAAGITCKFSWIDCTGGSSELWTIKLEMKSAGPFCTIGRAVDSYLTFSKWSAEISGGGVRDGSAEVFDGEGGSLLINSDFSVSPIPAGGVEVRNGRDTRHTVGRINVKGR